LDDTGSKKEAEVDDAGNSAILLRGTTKSRRQDVWCWPHGSGDVHGLRGRQTLPGRGA